MSPASCPPSPAPCPLVPSPLFLVPRPLSFCPLSLVLSCVVLSVVLTSVAVKKRVTIVVFRSCAPCCLVLSFFHCSSVWVSVLRSGFVCVFLTATCLDLVPCGTCFGSCSLARWFPCCFLLLIAFVATGVQVFEHVLRKATHSEWKGFPDWPQELQYEANGFSMYPFWGFNGLDENTKKNEFVDILSCSTKDSH